MLAHVYKLIGADAGMEDRCQLCSQQPNPSEPPTVDCDTCLEPTAVTMMVACDAEGSCSYTQCLSCVIKCGAIGCPDPACMYLHYNCPACRLPTFGEGLMLTDERLTKADVLKVLETTREHHVEVDQLVAGMMGMMAAELAGPSV